MSSLKQERKSLSFSYRLHFSELDMTSFTVRYSNRDRLSGIKSKASKFEFWKKSTGNLKS